MPKIVRSSQFAPQIRNSTWNNKRDRVNKELITKIAGTVGILSTLGGHIASADVLPGAAQAEQISRSLSSRHIPPPKTPTSPLSAPEQKESPLLEQAKKITFTLNEILLEGNYVYSTAELEKLYRNKLHTKISVADLFGIVSDITDFYRNNGYILSQATLPPQHIKNGIVHIKIIEGFIDQVEVTGLPFGTRRVVENFGKKIASHKPLQLKYMEKYLLLADELPGTNVKSVLAPSKTIVGAADLTLVTENKPITGYASYDNYGSRYTGPQEITANLSFNSLITSGDDTQVTVVKTPKGQELTYVDVNYGTQISREGTRWLLGATRAATHPLFVLESSDINGLNTIYYTNLQFPIIRSFSQSLTLQLGFGFSYTNSTSLGLPLYTDRVRSLNFDTIYNLADRFHGSNFMMATLRKGLPIFGYTTQTNPETAQTSRPGGNANYFKIVLTLSRTQAIKGAWSLYAMMRAQKAFVPVLAGEQFAYGGSQLGRGYDVAEILGDKGMGGTAELRYDWAIGKFWLQGLQFYAFYDAGVVWNYADASNPNNTLKQSAMSTGFGSRFYSTQSISGNLMWTQPLTKQVAAEELIGRGKCPRIFFSVVFSA